MMRLECGYAPTTSLKADMASGNVQSRAGRLAQHTRMVILRIVDGFYPLGWAKWSDEYVRPDSSVCSCGAPPPPAFTPRQRAHSCAQMCMRICHHPRSD